MTLVDIDQNFRDRLPNQMVLSRNEPPGDGSRGRYRRGHALSLDTSDAVAASFKSGRERQIVSSMPIRIWTLCRQTLSCVQGSCVSIPAAVDEGGSPKHTKSIQVYCKEF